MRECKWTTWREKWSTINGRTEYWEEPEKWKEEDSCGCCGDSLQATWEGREHHIATWQERKKKKTRRFVFHQQGTAWNGKKNEEDSGIISSMWERRGCFQVKKNGRDAENKQLIRRKIERTSAGEVSESQRRMDWNKRRKKIDYEDNSIM